MLQSPGPSTPAPGSRLGADALARTVFDGFPFGLLVTEAGGAVLAANPESLRVLAREDAAGKTCCALLGCHEPTGPFANACITSRALAEGRALPEVRVDFTAHDGMRAVWVTAAPLAPGQALLHLRPGRPGDRRRRADPTWTAGPQLHVRVLGRTHVQAAEGPLLGPWLRQRPGQLLKLLICNRRGMTHSDELATTFWPHADRKALQNVRYCVHDLRGRLEPGREARRPSSFVIGLDGGYGLDLDRVRVDADEFEQLARTGLAAAGAGDDALARQALDRAAELYQGPFLADEPYADWALPERDRLHHLACRVLEALVELAVAEGDADAAVGRLQRLSELEPLDESVQRRHLAMLLELGRAGEALRRFKQVQAAWRGALGEDVPFELGDLRPAAAA